jgi:hypothetical protein
MATEKQLKGYDPITLESFTRHMTKHREPYDQYDMGYVDAVEQIENFLEYNTVDAVEVVRCKDCVHWYETEGVCLKIYSDGAVSPYAWQDRNPDDYCSYGERKDND